MKNKHERFWILLILFGLLTAFSSTPAKAASLQTNFPVSALDPNQAVLFNGPIMKLHIPDRVDHPFPYDPDPTQCGISADWRLEDGRQQIKVNDEAPLQPAAALQSRHLRFIIKPHFMSPKFK